MDIQKETFEENFKKTETYRRECAIRNKDILEFSKTMNGYFNIVVNDAWNMWQAAKEVPAVVGDIQSWIAVKSFSALDSSIVDFPVVDANELAEYIDSLDLNFSTPEGFVLVPKADLESWHLWDGDYENMYRDNYSEVICDHVELGAVFEIDAKMAFKVEPIYVVPVYSDSDDYEYEEFESEEIAKKAAEENKAMIEAQEQSHD